MVFTASVDYEYIAGGYWVCGGSWDSAGVTTGEIPTRLRYILGWKLSHKGSAVEASVAAVNETIPGDLGDNGYVTIITTSGDAGTWEATGYR